MAVRRCFSREISTLGYSSKLLHQNQKARIKHSVLNCTDIGDKKCVIALDSFLMDRVGIHKQLFTSKSTVQLNLADGKVKMENCAPALRKVRQERTSWGRYLAMIHWKHILSSRYQICAVPGNEQRGTSYYSFFDTEARCQLFCHQVRNIVKKNKKDKDR